MASRFDVLFGSMDESSSNKVATNTGPCDTSTHSKRSTPSRGRSGPDGTLPLYLVLHSADLLGVLKFSWFFFFFFLYTLKAPGVCVMERNNLQRKIFQITKHRVTEQTDVIPQEAFKEVRGVVGNVFHLS